MKQEQILEIIKNNLPIGFSIVDQNGMIVDFNNAAETITGFSKNEVLGRSHGDILHGSADKEACPLLKQTIQKHEETVAIESVIRKKNGDRIIILVTTFPLIDRHGNFLGGVELFRDITASKKLERERKNILSMFAHDMKNPVMTSAGFIARLLVGKAGELTTKQRSYLELIQKELLTVENLIVDFLEFSRLETKEYAPQKEALDMKAAIQKSIESIKIEADKKKIAMLFECPAGQNVVIDADPVMIDRVVSNLLSNAVKYTEPEGTIRIILMARDKEIVAEVTDSGIGIPERHLPYIFDAFIRVSRDSKGTGLGLAIVKTIIKLHGGRIWVESALNKGSTFSFTIPR